MAEETLYTAKTGLATISTANSNLDGTGSVTTVITGASNGTLIKSVIIKAVTSTSKGMIRFFIDDGSGINTGLLFEVPVPAVAISGVTMAFETKVNMNFTLNQGYTFKVSTENADTFNIICEALDWSYPSLVRKDTTKYTSNNGSTVISTANANLDGSGTLGSVYSAGTSATYKGSSISCITIKGIVNVTAGMVRIYIDDLSTKYLFMEVPISTVTKSSTDQAFERTIDFSNDFELQAGYKIQASTQNAENFHVFITGRDWNYYN